MYFPSLAVYVPVLAQAGNPTGFLSSQLFVMVLLFAGMWFLLIAPQRKKQKEHKAMLNSLQTGDEVLTNGGLYGTITNVKDDRFIVKVGEHSKVEVNKAYIQTKIEA